MSEVVILMGIPASGKTTFYRERFFPSHVYVSLDQVKSRSAENELFEFCLRRQKNCAIDNTNIRPADRKRYIDASRALKMRVVGYCFLSSKYDALKRNRERVGLARVPEAAVRTKYADMVYPKMEEGFDELFYVTLDDDGFNVEACNEKRNQ